MVGAVYLNEMTRSGRGRLVHFARWAYAAWLVLWVWFGWSSYCGSQNTFATAGASTQGGASAWFARGFVDAVVLHQTLLVLLVAPTFAAGAVTDEKVKGTLEPLFLAHLRPGAIIVGKLLARVTQVFLWSLVAWPVIAVFGLPGGVAPIFFVALAVMTLLMLSGTCAVSLLISVWTRTTRDAVAVSYMVMGAGIALNWYGPRWPALLALDPNYVLDTARDAPDFRELGDRLWLSAQVWGGMALLCTLLAVWRLRPAYIKQQQRRAPWFARFSFRPAVSDRPLAWKEQHLTRIPQWFGLMLVAGISLYLGVIMAETSFNPSYHASTYFGFQWFALFLLSLAAGVRASATIVAERDRKTWDGVLSTPLDFHAIIDDKIAGIVNSLRPYYFAFLIPQSFVMSIADDIGGFPVATLVACVAVLGVVVRILMNVDALVTGWFLFLVSVGAAANSPPAFIGAIVGSLFVELAMRLMGGIGIWFSVRSTNAWLGLLGTVVIGYLTAACLAIASAPICCVFGCLFHFARLTVPKPVLDILDSQVAMFVIGGTGCAALFHWGAHVARRWAAAYLEKTDRVPGHYVRMIELDQPFRGPKETPET